MFGGAKIRIDNALWNKIKKYAELAGYSSPEEFVTHVLEKEFAALEEGDSDESIKEKLKGLGYIS
jgi:hypothetical protein